jgi:hypothetical protein
MCSARKKDVKGDVYRAGAAARRGCAGRFLGGGAVRRAKKVSAARKAGDGV